jgi:hypothetical protein
MASSFHFMKSLFSGISPIAIILPPSMLIPPRGSSADERQAARTHAPGRKRRLTAKSAKDAKIPAALLCALCVLCGVLFCQIPLRARICVHLRSSAVFYRRQLLQDYDRTRIARMTRIRTDQNYP